MSLGTFVMTRREIHVFLILAMIPLGSVRKELAAVSEPELPFKIPWAKLPKSIVRWFEHAQEDK